MLTIVNLSSKYISIYFLTIWQFDKMTTWKHKLLLFYCLDKMTTWKHTHLTVLIQFKKWDSYVYQISYFNAVIQKGLKKTIHLITLSKQMSLFANISILINLKMLQLLKPFARSANLLKSFVLHQRNRSLVFQVKIWLESYSMTFIAPYLILCRRSGSSLSWMG